MLQRSRPARLHHTLTGRHVTRCADSPWQSSPEKHITPCLAHRTGSDLLFYIQRQKKTPTFPLENFLSMNRFALNLNWLLAPFWIFLKIYWDFGDPHTQFLSLPFLLLSRHRCSDFFFFIRWKPESMWRKSTRFIGEVDLSRGAQWSISQGKIIKNCVNVIRRHIWGYVLFSVRVMVALHALDAVTRRWDHAAGLYFCLISLYGRFVCIYSWPLLHLKRYLMTPYISCPQRLVESAVEAC